MAKTKPECPNCGAKSFTIRRTFAIQDNCHDLERKRFSYYKCSICGCECLLTTPQGKLEIIQGGMVTRDMAQRVLAALNLPVELAEKLNQDKNK